MTPSHRLLAAAFTAALLGAGCASSTEPVTADDITAAAQTFDQLADSLVSVGADASLSDSYREIANAVRSSSTLSRVNIAVDGASAEFLATAHSLDQNYCPPGLFCAAIYRQPLSFMIAWQRDNPRNVVQLVTGIGRVLASDGLSTIPDGTQASITYFDGSGGVFAGTTDAQSIVVTPTEGSCTVPNLPTIYPGGSSLSCTGADFVVSFSGTVRPSLYPTKGNTAVGSHGLDMPAQHVTGQRLLAPYCYACVVAPPFAPPVAIGTGSFVLPSALTVSQSAGDVALTFTVTNSFTSDVQLDFLDEQQYDFVVRSSATNAVAWRWSAGRVFAQSALSRLLAPGASVSYTEHWTPPASGAYTAIAFLTSSSHGAIASTSFAVP